MDKLEVRLIQYNWLTSQQLELARQDSQKSGKSLWVSLVKLGFMTEEDIVIFFAQESGINYVRISDYELDVDTVHLLPEDFSRQHIVIPLFRIQDTLYVACNNPFDTALTDLLIELTGISNIELLFSSSRSINQALDLYWGPPERNFASAEFVENVYKQNTPTQGLAFWRDSDRLGLNIPVTVKVEDKSIVLHYSSPLEGITRNISNNGALIALQIIIFLPRGTKVSLEFKPCPKLSVEEKIIQAKGEVAHCRMEKGLRYFLGVRFTELDDDDRQQLFKLANSSP